MAWKLSTQPSVPVSAELDDIDDFLTLRQQVLGTIKDAKLKKCISESQIGGMPKNFISDQDEVLGKINDEFIN